jgi:EPS-associated MarR family transcriptional regulator
VDKGWIKAANFKNSRNKTAYMYLLTPRGIDAKTRVTARFLQRKVREYEALRTEIEQLRIEAERQPRR